MYFALLQAIIINRESSSNNTILLAISVGRSNDNIENNFLSSFVKSLISCLFDYPVKCTNRGKHKPKHNRVSCKFDFLERASTLK